MSSLERKIAALRLMTVAHGCTQAEARAAASKVAQLEARLPERLWAAVERDLVRYANAGRYQWREPW